MRVNNGNQQLGSSANLTIVERVAFALLWILVFSIPAEGVMEIPGFGTITKLIGMVAITGGVLAVFASNRIRVWNQTHLVIVFFIVWSGVTSIWSLSPEMTGARFTTYMQLFGMVLLIWQLCLREFEELRLLQAYVLGVCVVSGDTMVRFLLAKQTYYQRYASEGSEPNDLALTCCIAIPISYYLSLRSAGWMVWFYRMVVGIALTTILLSASRSGALASLAALSIIPWTYRYISRKQKIGVIAAALCLAVGLAVFTPTTSWNRLGTVAPELSEGTMNSRTVIWKAGLDALREAPFGGIGAGAYPIVSEAILGSPKTRLVAHNSFLSVLTETGIIGFTLFSVLLGMLGFYIYRLPELERRFWTVTLATWTIGVSTLTWEHRKPTWLLFGLILVRGASGLRGPASWRGAAPAELQDSYAEPEIAC
jgi:O-antigen ligase